MQGVRGQNKSPRKYRQEQNWIGPPGSELEEANFVPIAPEQLLAGMDSWEVFITNRDYPDSLVQLAIAHVEFEALHPFLDGNGRLGRMFIPLFLYDRELRDGPNFYMSGYFEQHRDSYIQRLRDISAKNAWTAWCSFFLKVIIDQAPINAAKAREILGLYERLRTEVADLTGSARSVRAVNFIFQNPIFSATDFVNTSEIPVQTAYRLLRVLTDNNILQIIRQASGRRPVIYMFPELLKIADG